MPKIAIVILNWNGLHYLQQFLPSVMATSYPDYDVVVADNGSTDESVSFLKKNYPRIRILTLNQNFGFAKGYNAALRKVSADYYVILNSDVEVNADWLQPMSDLLEGNETIAACQPKIRSYQQRTHFEYAGAAGGWIDRYGYPFAKGRIFDVIEEDKGQYNQPAAIFWASGAALFIRSSVFHRLGGFDEYFFAHQEEIDLCWRVQLAGYQVYSCPDAVVYHVGGGTLARGNPQKTFLNFRNNLIMLSKNLPLRSKWKIPYRMLLDVVSAWKGLLSGDRAYFNAIWKAHAAFLRWLFGAKDRQFFPRNKAGQLQGYYRHNIVWQHFIRKKNHFSEIIP